MKTRIKDLREDHDLTQTEVSKILNISQVAYSYYELNRRNIYSFSFFLSLYFYSINLCE